MKKLLKKIVPRSLVNLYRTARYGKFYVLQQDTDGLLQPKNYERIYNEVRKLPDLDIVEIGGAGGTASIAIGWAMKDDHKKSKLIVVEKCEGGTRAQYGGKTENLNRIQQNLARYGVAPQCKIFPEYLTFENGAEALKLVETPQIAALMMDADGWIHRDFHFFWSRLAPGGLIIVDDYKEGRDPKHDLTFHLLNQLIEWGLFEKMDAMGDTFFGRKPANGDISKLDLNACAKIVEDTCRKYNVVFNRDGIVPK